MKWEELTSPEFADAVTSTRGTCIIPLGVIEKHGPHLPLGTDLLHVKAMAEKAAELEPMIVFPSYYFTQITDAKPQPGTISLNHDLLLGLLENVCEEIGRNGCKKIILLNGHGGNGHFLPFFVDYMMREKERNFNLYLLGLENYWQSDDCEEFQTLKVAKIDGHGGEVETSIHLYINEHLVKMDALKRDNDGTSKLRQGPLSPVSTGFNWFAEYPGHYMGDGTEGTKEKGKILFHHKVKKIVEWAKLIKDDTRIDALKKEFFKQSRASQN